MHPLEKKYREILKNLFCVFSFLEVISENELQ